MRRNHSRLRKMKYYNIFLSSICGIILIAALILLFSYAGSKCDFPLWLISASSGISMTAGGFLSGFIYGKQKRRKGIINGFLCGAVIYFAVFIFGIIYLKGFPPLRLIRFMLILCISGAAGGITGVNSKIRRPPP